VGESEVTLQLKPEELGRVDIKLSFGDDNTVTGTVVADSKATLEMLSKDVGGLQRALQDAGLRVDDNSLQFALRGDGQNAFAQDQGNYQNQNQGQNRSFAGSGWQTATTTLAVASEDESAAETGMGLGRNLVNLKV
jgi:flagellar hook-length control protein FliK